MINKYIYTSKSILLPPETKNIEGVFQMDFIKIFKINNYILWLGKPIRV